MKIAQQNENRKHILSKKEIKKITLYELGIISLEDFVKLGGTCQTDHQIIAKSELGEYYWYELSIGSIYCSAIVLHKRNDHRTIVRVFEQGKYCKKEDYYSVKIMEECIERCLCEQKGIANFVYGWFAIFTRILEVIIKCFELVCFICIPRIGIVVGVTIILFVKVAGILNSKVQKGLDTML